MPPKKDNKTQAAKPSPAKPAAAAAKAVTKGVKYVPENILKKQARDAKLMEVRKKTITKNKTDRAAARKAAFASAEKFYNEYQAADAALIKAKRDAKAAGSFFVEDAPKVAFVVRIKG